MGPMSKHLIIVESPTKAKTIGKFLGKDYRVLSSFGHIRDLPKSKLGVDPDKDFKPTYQISDEKKDKVKELVEAAGNADEIILATDEDREGEAIAWHIAEVLKMDPKTAKRITFHEITKPAIAAALEHPRHIEMNMVHAQQARRIVDRLVGYELSPLLWEKIRRGLSAGRVQSVTVRLIVERERERQAFKIDEYWTIDGVFTKDAKDFEARLLSINGEKLDKLAVKTEAEAKKLEAALTGASFKVTNVDKKDLTKAPPTPFTTSALQIEANNRLGYGAKQTMMLAQKLYETGRITYMRTDSVNLAEPFLADAQAFIKDQYGADYAQGAKHYKTKAKGAQEAHEAIRPTDVRLHPDDLRAELDPKMWKVYDLIWRRTVASQMPSATLERTSVDLEAKAHVFRATGHAMKRDGFMKVYRGAEDKLLPVLSVGMSVDNKELKAVQHFTEPPARYSDATIVKALEELGIGRPSTYAPTIATVEARGYVERDDNKKLKPTDIAFTVTDLLVAHFPQIADFAFTAKMEKDLDEVADTGEWVPMLKEFYGDFHKTIVENEKKLKREDYVVEKDLGVDTDSGLTVFVRTGRFGPFVQLGELSKDKKAPKPKRASLPKGKNVDEVNLAQALVLLSLPRTLGKNERGDDVVATNGRFGPYLKAGEETASLQPPMDVYTITLDQALPLLKDATEKKRIRNTPLRVLGQDPETGVELKVMNGRYGPYVTDGETMASLGKAVAVEEITIPQAKELIAKKKAAPKRAWKRKPKAEEASE